MKKVKVALIAVLILTFLLAFAACTGLVVFSVSETGGCSITGVGATFCSASAFASASFNAFSSASFLAFSSSRCFLNADSLSESFFVVSLIA